MVSRALLSIFKQAPQSGFHIFPGVTQISLLHVLVIQEHCHILGHTVDAIGAEKAGIIKPSIPAVLGPTVPVSVEKVPYSVHYCCYGIVQ